MVFYTIVRINTFHIVCLAFCFLQTGRYNSLEHTKSQTILSPSYRIYYNNLPIYYNSYWLYKTYMIHSMNVLLFMFLYSSLNISYTICNLVSKAPFIIIQYVFHKIIVCIATLLLTYPVDVRPRVKCR
jgi:hypothetical protein